MRDETHRDLAILNAIAENDRITQRHLAGELGIAVSLVNLYLRRLVFKGFIRVIKVRPNRLRYLLTPKGVAEKSRLAHLYMCGTFERYREARRTLQAALRFLGEDANKRIAFYGTGEAAEVAYLCLKEAGLDLAAVFEDGEGDKFLGLRIRRVEEIVPGDFDRIVVTSFSNLEETEAKVQELLRLGVTRDRIVTLQR